MAQHFEDPETTPGLILAESRRSLNANKTSFYNQKKTVRVG